MSILSFLARLSHLIQPLVSPRDGYRKLTSEFIDYCASNTTDLRYKKMPNKTLRGAMQFTAACTTGHGKGLPSAFESSVALAAVISLLVSITFQQKKKKTLTYRMGI